ncbi:MAG: accessory gene regulator ArgB-like protein [Syntrophomonadaceae bacterium]|jgi:accessory gene regulator B
MIKTLSMRIASNLGFQLRSSEAEVEVYAYGLESFFNNFFAVLLLFLIAWGLQIIVPTLLVLTAFGLVRVPGGGAHLETYPRCLISSLLAMLILAILSTMFQSVETWTLLLGVVILAGGFVVVCAWVPAGTEKKMITDPAQVKQQKYITSATLLTAILTASWCIYRGFPSQAAAIIMGSMWGLFIITPLGYQVFHILDQGLDYLLRR